MEITKDLYRPRVQRAGERALAGRRSGRHYQMVAEAQAAARRGEVVLCVSLDRRVVVTETPMTNAEVPTPSRGQQA
jgi:hypothetical protein